MAGTYPTTPAFLTVDFRINTPTLSTETISGIRRRVGMGHSFYTFSARYNNMTRTDFAPVIAFIAAQYGSLEEFQIVLPEISYTKATNQTSNSVTTSASASRGDNSVNITGAGAGEQVLVAGDYFKFNNHSKVYQCVTTWTSGQPLYFSGSLVDDVPSGTALTITQVPFTVILDNDIQEYQTGVGGISTMTVDFKENWA